MQREMTQHEQDLEYIRNFRLLDDDFAKKVLDDEKCTELVLQIIMEKPDLKVLRVQTEYEIHNIWGRSVRFDVDAVDSTGNEYNIEIQRADRGAEPKRARYNSSLIDANALSRGEKSECLPETYIIFITENDVLSKGLPIYHIERTIQETGEIFDDKAHIIYVNSEITDNTPLGILMHDFRCTSAQEMQYSVLSERVRYFKENEKGVGSMCKAMEEMRDRAEARGMAKGIEQGIEQGIIKSIKALIDNAHYTAQQAMDILNIDADVREQYMEMLKNV